MEPAEVKQELDKNRESVHELRGALQTVVLTSQQTQQSIPQIFAKLDALGEKLGAVKDLMHDHGKDTEFLKGEVKLIGEKTTAAMLLLGVKMDAADKATDSKVDEHLASHKKWFPIIPALIVSFVLAVAGAIFALIKKG